MTLTTGLTMVHGPRALHLGSTAHELLCGPLLVFSATLEFLPMQQTPSAVRVPHFPSGRAASVTLAWTILGSGAALVTLTWSLATESAPVTPTWPPSGGDGALKLLSRAPALRRPATRAMLLLIGFAAYCNCMFHMF